MRVSMPRPLPLAALFSLCGLALINEHTVLLKVDPTSFHFTPSLYMQRISDLFDQLQMETL